MYKTVITKVPINMVVFNDSLSQLQSILEITYGFQTRLVRSEMYFGCSRHIHCRHAFLKNTM